MNTSNPPPPSVRHCIGAKERVKRRFTFASLSANNTSPANNGLIGLACTRAAVSKAYSTALYNIHKETLYSSSGQITKNPNRPVNNKYSGTPLIRINWDGEPSGSAENPDSWIFFFLATGYIGSLKFDC